MPKRLIYLTTSQSADHLAQLAYLERACAHILAGWIVKTPDLDVKINWGQQLAADMEAAARLRDRSLALAAGLSVQHCVPHQWLELARNIDRARDTRGVMAGLQRVKSFLAARYSEFLQRADPVADASSLQLVDTAARAAQQQLRWMRRRVGQSAQPAPLPSPSRGRQVPVDEGLWPPLDRVPRVVRPEWIKRGEPGALRALPIRPRRDTGLFLHNFLNEEFATLELIARNSYEFADMPWAFHRDAARHAGDEARHAQLFVRALPDYGIRYGDYPIYTYSYEGEYEFEPCEPGSRRELLWRILLRQVVHEGLALDSTPFEVQKRAYLKQPELARIFGYTLADEVFHAASGIKWAHYLVGDDHAAFERERDAAYSYYKDRLKDRRLTWGAAHIAEAAYEARQLDELARHYRFPFKIQVNEAARKRAGFTDDEIRRAREERTSNSRRTG